MDYFIGCISIFSGNFAPSGWMLCQGQLLPISQYEALFTILGTTYGGDGQTTFALPNLSSRTPIQQGQGPGLTSRALGQTGGEETVTLTAQQMPSHTHLLMANGTASNSANPQGNVYGLALDSASGTEYPFYSPTMDNAMAPGALQAAGGSQPHENMPPFLAINYIICVEGIYPSQN